MRKSLLLYPLVNMPELQWDYIVLEVLIRIA